MSLNRRDFVQRGGALFVLGGCVAVRDQEAANSQIEVFDPALKTVLDSSSEIVELGRGYTWSEGPAWDPVRRALYFTDVPENIAYKWTEARGVEVFLDPSGTDADVAGFREPGANGLLYGRDGSLIVCNHGRRGVERLDLDTMERELLIGHYDGQALNSPNDVVEAADGTLYFTDPPYGLEGLNASPLKAQTANRVYALRPDGRLDAVKSDMTFPNGVALSPDGSRLYVTQSDPEAPVIRELKLDTAGVVTSDTILFDAKPYMAADAPGLPDGLAISEDGHLFVTGPGGVLVLQPDGHLIGRIRTGSATANCAFGEDGTTLFITAQDRLLKVSTKTRGAQWS